MQNEETRLPGSCASPATDVPETPSEAKRNTARKAGTGSVTVTLTDGDIRELVNRLRQISISYHATQQLRARLSNAVFETLERCIVNNKSQT